MIILKNNKGSMIIWAPVIMLILLSGIVSLCEYSRLQSAAMTARNAVQASITQVCTDNSKNVYTGIREGYAGGYKLENVSWDNNVSSSDILSKVDAKLGSSGGVKSVNGKLIYKITDLSVSIQNAPLAPTDTDGVQQLTGTATFTLTVPLSFCGQSLPPMVINDMKVIGGYSQKGDLSGTGGGSSDQGKAATGIALSESQLTMEKGAIDTLAASVSPEDATDNISWVATNPGVCSVDQTGTITARNAGQSTIVAAAQSGGAIAQCNVTVVTAVTGVTLNKSDLTLAKGQSETLKATISPTDATNKKGKWASSDASVCTVDGNGTVYAVNAGTAVVSAVTEDGGFTDQCTVTVVIPTSGITLNKTNLMMIKGTTETLTATVWPGDATKATVLWASSDESICTVDQAGKIVAIKPGNAVVSATTYDGQYTAVCAVTVKPNTYRVYANAVNGYVTGTGIYNAGSAVTLTAVPNPHYHFVCWTDNYGNVISWNSTYTIYNLSADTTVNANFAIDMFTVSLSAGTGGYVTGGGTYPYGTWVTISATPYSGYKFKNWSDGYTGASRSFTVTGNVSYTAYFEIDFIVTCTPAGAATATNITKRTDGIEMIYGPWSGSVTTVRAGVSFNFSSPIDIANDGRPSIYAKVKLLGISNNKNQLVVRCGSGSLSSSNNFDDTEIRAFWDPASPVANSLYPEGYYMPRSYPTSHYETTAPFYLNLSDNNRLTELHFYVEVPYRTQVNVLIEDAYVRTTDGKTIDFMQYMK
jgi:Bacterial surface proteins containing Ig-like domains